MFVPYRFRVFLDSARLSGNYQANSQILWNYLNVAKTGLNCKALSKLSEADYGSQICSTFLFQDELIAKRESNALRLRPAQFDCLSVGIPD